MKINLNKGNKITIFQGTDNRGQREIKVVYDLDDKVLILIEPDCNIILHETSQSSLDHINKIKAIYAGTYEGDDAAEILGYTNNVFTSEETGLVEDENIKQEFAKRGLKPEVIDFSNLPVGEAGREIGEVYRTVDGFVKVKLDDSLALYGQTDETVVQSDSPSGTEKVVTKPKKKTNKSK